MTQVQRRAIGPAVVTNLVILLGLFMVTEHASAQLYSCFPTCSQTDGKFLALAGAGASTFAGDTMRLELTATSTSDSISIGIFDGESGGLWDIGTTPLEFTLLADSTASGNGRYQVGQWSGSSMTDNAWYTVKVANVAQARTPSGSYYYTLRVRITDPNSSTISSFKVHTDGTISLLAGQSFNIYAPIPNANSARIIYPHYPLTDTTTYDGNWTFRFRLDAAATSMTIWDGDMDYGSYDGSVMDTDDEDTPNDQLPDWAVGHYSNSGHGNGNSGDEEDDYTDMTHCRHEGVAHGNPGIDALGVPNGAMSTGAPADDERRPMFARPPAINYEIVDPSGNHYVNNNPSGNLEWEQFKISTAPFDRSQMDYHADSIPSGDYMLVVHGMDMANINAFHLFTDALGSSAIQFAGIDTSGRMIAPPPAMPPDTGSIAGTVFYDLNQNGRQDVTEIGIPGVKVKLKVDYNGDNRTDDSSLTKTDDNGNYLFTKLKRGSYTVAIDTGSIATAVAPTYTPQSSSAPFAQVLTLDATHTHLTAPFSLRSTMSITISGADTVSGSSTQTFTAQSNTSGVQYQWSIQGAGTINGSTTGSSVSVTSGDFGSCRLTATATRDGVRATTSKDVAINGKDFVLFAYDFLYAEGREHATDTTRGFINGNVGVNLRVGSCWPLPVLILGSTCGSTSHAVYMPNGTRVIGDYVSLGGSAVSVYDLLANRTTSGTVAAHVRHSGPTTFTGQVIDPRNLPVLPNFTYGCSNISVSANGSRTLSPGSYNTITLGNGATLTLSDGKYYLKSLSGGNHVRINTSAGTKLYIASSFIIGNACYVGSSNTALFAVRSDCMCLLNPSVSIGDSSEFHGQVFVPNGMIDLEDNATATGRFWGRLINVDYNVNVNFASPVTTFTSTNNSGFQKRQNESGSATTGGTIFQGNYPNPFDHETKIRFTLPFDDAVTLTIFDALGHQVRALAENVSMTKGANAVTWDGEDDNSIAMVNGIYFCRLQMGDAIEVQPLTIAR